MATSDAEPVAVPTYGRSNSRRVAGLVGQYGLLTLLSVLVLGPLVLTVFQAMSPPFVWVNRGRPWHPVDIAWKDRTWWTGGAPSVIVRTLVVVALLAWLQKVAADRGWTPFRTLATPARVGAVVVGTLVFTFGMGPVFASFHDADGRSGATLVVVGLAVAATQVLGFRSSGQTWVGASISALTTGIGLVGIATLFVGPEVWTKSWGAFELGPAMGRSLVMAVLITVAQVATAIMSAYAFVFLRFPLKRTLFALFMATLLLPLEVTLVGNVATIRQLEWTDTYQALVLPFAAAALGTFLIRQGFRGLPPDIRDATRVDGYGHLAFMTRFAVPLTRPVIASFTVISALTAWNQYLWPRAVIETNSFNTLQIQLRLASAGQVANANESIAAALVAAVPVAIVLVLFQRQIIRGLTAGAVK